MCLIRYASYLLLDLFEHSAQQTMFLFQVLSESLYEGVHVACNVERAGWSLSSIALDEGKKYMEVTGMSRPGPIGSCVASHADFTLAWNVLVVFCKIC